MRAGVRLGYGRSIEVRPGIWEDDIFETPHLAEVLQTTEAFTVSGNIIPEYKTTTSVSVVSSGPPMTGYTLRYVLWNGERWAITSAVAQPPRLNIFIGEVYGGPIPSGTPDGA